MTPDQNKRIFTRTAADHAWQLAHTDEDNGTLTFSKAGVELVACYWNMNVSVQEANKSERLFKKARWFTVARLLKNPQISTEDALHEGFLHNPNPAWLNQ